MSDVVSSFSSSSSSASLRLNCRLSAASAPTESWGHFFVKETSSKVLTTIRLCRFVHNVRVVDSSHLWFVGSCGDCDPNGFPESFQNGVLALSERVGWLPAAKKRIRPVNTGLRDTHVFSDLNLFGEFTNLQNQLFLRPRIKIPLTDISSQFYRVDYSYLGVVHLQLRWRSKHCTRIDARDFLRDSPNHACCWPNFSLIPHVQYSQP